MVRARVVNGTLALASLLAAVALASPPAGPDRQGETPAAAGAHAFDALMKRLPATLPGTYLVDGTTLVPVPDASRIPVLLQADVLRGPEGTARVGIVVGADATQAVDVRLRVSTAAPTRDANRVVAEAEGKGTAGPVRLVREFGLAPGEYELEAIVGHPAPGVGVIAAVARARLTVPDIQGGSLAVTPIVAGEAAPSAGQSERPFVFGKTALSPAVSPRLPQDGSLSVAFRVYNWTARDQEKPDLTVEYLFYEQGKRGLHFFNKVKPQQLTADTLGTAFDSDAGSVAAGMMIPMAPFTFGDFQLVVRVTDNRNTQSAEQKVAFTVAP
jgi:hypothetical protein